MGDLIERLKERRNSRCPSGKNREYINVTIDIDLLDEAITALSPVLPDEVIEELEAALRCFEHHAYRDISDQSFANDVIAELGGLPNERTPIAALQESE